MSIVSNYLKLLENRFNMMSDPGICAAKTDEKFYDTKQLSSGERQQAMALLAEQNLPEGSICVMKPGEQKDFDVVPDLEKEKEGKGETDWSKLSGRKWARKIVGERFLKNSEWAGIDTVVIPGCASSPLGAAALGKTLAKMYNTKVAAIVAGQGAFDMWMEANSGAMLMAPMANALNAFNPLLEISANFNPTVARDYILDLLDTIHEAATLYALLEARYALLEKGKFDNLRMIVSHSKGNWAVLTALLALELEHGKTLTTKYEDPKEPIEPIDIVTFGNPVDLPHKLHPIMLKLFRYFQFVGENDTLGHNCSAIAWRFHFTGVEKLDPDNPKLNELSDSNKKPVEKLEKIVAHTGHHLAPNEEFKMWSKPIHHMPIEKILEQIRPPRATH